MTTKNKILLQAANLLLCAAIILLTAFFMSGWSVLVQAAFYAVAAAGLAAEAVFLFIKKEFLIKLTFIAELIAVVLLAVFVLLGVFADLNAYPTDREKIEAVIALVRSTGEWGMLVFVLIQFLQVVVLPLPAVVCYVPGAVIWSPLTATLLASAGVIAMNFPYFAGVIVLVRPLIIAAYCFLGNGSIIPFSGWGIPVWLAIIAVFATLAVLSFKYQKRFEDWLFSKFSRKKDKHKKEEKAQETIETEE